MSTPSTPKPKRQRRRRHPVSRLGIPDPLPCPHCGSPAEYLVLWTCVVDAMKQNVPRERMRELGMEEGCVRCSVCRARTARGTQEQAITAWNRRIKA